MTKFKWFILQGPLGLSGAPGYPGGPGMKVGIYNQYFIWIVYIRFI